MIRDDEMKEREELKSKIENLEKSPKLGTAD